VPEFAHLSTILGGDRERLSKRHGATSIRNFRDAGVLPEALTNYLALLGWAPPGGTREIFSRDELVREFSIERVTPSPAVFDMEKLYWLNRHYIKQSPPQRIENLALPYWSRTLGDGALELAAKTPAEKPGAQGIHNWLGSITRLLAPYVDRLDQLPERASLIFHYDARAALASSDNAEVLDWPHTDAVLARFTVKILENQSACEGRLTSEEFKKIVNEVKAETGAKGKELFHPVRIVVTGSHSGPDFDKLIPILEEGSRQPLPRRVLGVRERVEQFARARGR
jgi:glutamyl-tRNA synthetase/nondiscriminating glutamyl-tRNA synthetase